ncbi:SWIB domain-containing protein [Aphelenchoides fujianensis]|nr:SWIB domain-containing protein [Aphelenchoides fujianensis]
MAALPVEQATLAKDVMELVRVADLKVMTSKSIRTQLETQYGVPLRDFRKQIDEVIHQSIVALRSEKKAKDEEPKPNQTTNGNAAKRPSPAAAANNASDEDEDSDDSSKMVDGIPMDDEDTDVYSAVKRRRAAQRPAKKEKTGRKNTAFTRICVLSDELYAILDRRYMRRSDVVKEMWAYFKKNNLLDPKDRRFVIPDERMRAVLGSRRVQAFGMMKILKNHIKDVDFLDEDARRTAIHEIEQLEDSGFIINPALMPSSSNSTNDRTTKPKSEIKKTMEKPMPIPPAAAEPRGKLVLRISKNKDRVVSVKVNDETEAAQPLAAPQANNAAAHSPTSSNSSSSASSSSASAADMEAPPHLDPELPNVEAASPASSSSSDSSDSSDSSSSSSASSPQQKAPTKNGSRGSALNEDLQLSESDSDDD